jgi:hypothetical protein
MKAIKIIKNYQGILSKEYIIAEDDAVETQILDIKEDPEYFKNDIVIEDRLIEGNTTLRLEEIEQGFADKELTVPVVATIYITHKSRGIKYRPGSFVRFIIGAVTLIIISCIFAGVTLKRAIDNTEDIRRDECYLFSQDGEPISLFAAGQLINYTDEGKIPQMIEVTWSSWYRHILEDPCIYCKEVSAGGGYCRRKHDE